MNLKRIVQVVLLATSGAGAYLVAADWSRQRAGDAAEPDAAVAPPAAPVTAVAMNSQAPLAVASAPPPRQRSIPTAEGNAFAPLNWKPAPPPPPPPAAPPPPPAPTAPPLPFVYVGMVESGADQPRAYLAKGDTLLMVAVGDEIEGKTYRVEQLSPSAVVLTYLPLGMKQTVNAPGAKP